MKTNLAAYFRLQQPFLAEALADPEAFANLLSLSKFLPPVPDTILEFRLNRPTPHIDLSLCLEPATPGYQFFLKEKSMSHYQHPIWQRLTKLMSACSMPTTLLQQDVSKVWLEFDITGSCNTLSLPGYYIDIHEFGLLNSNGFSPQQRADHITQLAEQVYATTIDEPMPKEQRLFLQHCLACLPTNTVVAYLGNMIPRGFKGTRFAVRGFQLVQLVKYLEQVNWTGNVDLLLGGIEGITDIAERVVFNFEVSIEVSGRIDIEFLITPPNAASGWPILLNRFVERGYCPDEKCQAILAWPGYLAHAGQSDWPSDLQQGKLFSGNYNQAIFQRAINHLKLIYRPDEPFEAKVYLSCRQMWVNLSQANFKPRSRDVRKVS